MGINYSSSSSRSPKVTDPGSIPGNEQNTKPVIMAISSASGGAIASTDDNEWVTGPSVTMAAVKNNSKYHIKVNAITEASGTSNGKGFPIIRLQRTYSLGTRFTYPHYGSTGEQGRPSLNTSSGTNSHPNAKSAFDKSLFSEIVKDSPNLKLGDTITYELQLKCGKTTNTSDIFYAYMGGIYQFDNTWDNQTHSGSAFIQVLEVAI